MKSTDESTQEMLLALSRYAPDAIRAINSTVPDTARTQLAVDKEMYPEYYALDRQNQLAGSQNELDIATGTGAKLAEQAGKLQEVVDPEFYKSRAVVGEGINKLLGGYDPYKLNDSEVEQINRGLAREGPVSQSNMNTIKNAQVFGDKGTERWKNFSTALTQAGSILPTLKSGFSGFEAATRRALSPLPANSSQAINTNFGFANNTLNEIGQNQRLAESKKKDTMDMVVQGTQAFSNIASGVGSFM